MLLTPSGYFNHADITVTPSDYFNHADI
jgi:hypothetical protein